MARVSRLVNERTKDNIFLAGQEIIKILAEV
jgi:hypothetical protein